MNYKKKANSLVELGKKNYVEFRKAKTVSEAIAKLNNSIEFFKEASSLLKGVDYGNSLKNKGIAHLLEEKLVRPRKEKIGILEEALKTFQELSDLASTEEKVFAEIKICEIQIKKANLLLNEKDKTSLLKSSLNRIKKILDEKDIHPKKFILYALDLKARALHYLFYHQKPPRVQICNKIIESGMKILEISDQEDYFNLATGLYYLSLGYYYLYFHYTYSEKNPEKAQKILKKSANKADECYKYALKVEDNELLANALILSYVSGYYTSPLPFEQLNTAERSISFAERTLSADLLGFTISNKIVYYIRKLVEDVKIDERKKYLSELESLYAKYKHLTKVIGNCHLLSCLYIYFAEIYYFPVWFNLISEEKQITQKIRRALHYAKKAKKFVIAERILKYSTDILGDIYLLSARKVKTEKNKVKYLKEASKAFKVALPIPAHVDYDLGLSKVSLAVSFFELGSILKKPSFIEEAIVHYELALNEIEKMKDVIGKFIRSYACCQHLAYCYIELEDFEKASNAFIRASDYYFKAFKLTEVEYFRDYSEYARGWSFLLLAQHFSKKEKNHEKATNYFVRASELIENIDENEANVWRAWASIEDAEHSVKKEAYKQVTEAYKKAGLILEKIISAREEERRYIPYITESTFLSEKVFDKCVIWKKICDAMANLWQGFVFSKDGRRVDACNLFNNSMVLFDEIIPQISEKDEEIRYRSYSLYTKGLFALERGEMQFELGNDILGMDYFAAASKSFLTANQLNVDMSLFRGYMFLSTGLFHLGKIRSSLGQKWVSFADLEDDYNLTISDLQDAARIFQASGLQKAHYSILGMSCIADAWFASKKFERAEEDKRVEISVSIAKNFEDSLNYFRLAEDIEKERYVLGLIQDSKEDFTALEKINLSKIIPTSSNLGMEPLPIPREIPSFEYISSERIIGEIVGIEEYTLVEVGSTLYFTLRLTNIGENPGYVNYATGFTKGLSIREPEVIDKLSVNSVISPGEIKEIEIHAIIEYTGVHRLMPVVDFTTYRGKNTQSMGKPVFVRSYPKGMIKDSVAIQLEQYIEIIDEYMEELGIFVGYFPIHYHDLPTFNKLKYYHSLQHETLADRFAIADPRSGVHILYDPNLTDTKPEILADLAAHEKYGHGFFLRKTKFGKQLVEECASRYGIRSLFGENPDIEEKYLYLVLQTKITSEGFAKWVSWKALNKLFEKVGENNVMREQIQILTNKLKISPFEDEEETRISHFFFNQKGRDDINPYTYGFQLFHQIEEKFGEKCVPIALKLAADHSFTPEELENIKTMLMNPKYCVDDRLESIARTKVPEGFEKGDINAFVSLISFD